MKKVSLNICWVFFTVTKQRDIFVRAIISLYKIVLNLDQGIDTRANKLLWKKGSHTNSATQVIWNISENSAETLLAWETMLHYLQSRPII